MNRINELLNFLSPELLELSDHIKTKIQELKNPGGEKGELYNNDQVVLITYADQFLKDGEAPLKTLGRFLKNDLEGELGNVHILPFYPWTSDDGFSPVNYHEVCPEYGDWSDVEALEADKMVDCVYNHLSSKSEFFQKALAGDKSCEKMFHMVGEKEYLLESFQEDIKKVVRPRTSPLFSRYETTNGPRYVWTTFSADQVDTNISNPKMVRYILDSFFLYIEKGAKFFRVDAVPFMWKELGTNCSHHPKTHAFVQLLRAIADEIGTGLLIITESNVPHSENITYWGNGEDEAHVIYNFSLAPLLLHGMTFQTNKYLSQWAEKVFDIGEKNAFLNFTATHDGIGLRGVEGIVPDEEVVAMCDRARSKGGRVGMKRSRDGSERPYELNVTWASYLKEDGEDEKTFVRKVVNSHAIVMFMPGIGAHYAHNFFGSENWTAGLEESGIARRLNRRKLSYPLEIEGASEAILSGLKDLIRFKKKNECFHPKAGFKCLELDRRVFAFERSLDGTSKTVVFNLSKENLSVDVGGDILKLAPYDLKFV